MFAPYSQTLSDSLEKSGWSFVQVQLSSSYLGYGVSSLDADALELRMLAEALHSSHSCDQLVLMGHSTGCQDVVRYMSKYGPKPGSEEAEAKAAQVVGTILQAPVSDREWLSMYPEIAENAARARELVAAGNGEEVVCRMSMLDNAPITAQRLASLYFPGGDDDMFSFDLSDEQLKGLLSPLGVCPCLILASGADEAVPPHLLPEIPKQAQRLAFAAGNKAVAHVIAGAKHAVEGHEAEVVEHVAHFVCML
jgi:pimeloyl-ACP methyl ester carboxylesterase